MIEIGTKYIAQSSIPVSGFDVVCVGVCFLLEPPLAEFSEVPDLSLSLYEIFSNVVYKRQIF